jgi:dTDP-4-amino-4,6-dideoxygalactose transaminase
MARIRRMRFFGFNAEKDIIDDGMNAKMTESAAALGLANLKHLDIVRKNRREKYELYQELLGDLDTITFQKYDPEKYNYSYMPVLFDTEERLLRTLEEMASEKIYPRRYFHPSLHDVKNFEKVELPVAQSVASRIACLPLYNELAEADIRRICGLIKG